MAEIFEIIRRITRDAGSAYKANTKDVRARDVQMLFADASTGSHSPALVRQGQISELINAKPKARRRVLEEAAASLGKKPWGVFCSVTLPLLRPAIITAGMLVFLGTIAEFGLPVSAE